MLNSSVPLHQSFTLKKSPSWARILRHPIFMPYYRWIFVVVFINLVLFLHSDTAMMPQLPILINFFLAIFFRNQQFINLLFRVATAVPTHWPLHIRWAMGKVYHFGGIAVGAFFCGSLWFAFALWQQWQSHSVQDSHIFPVIKFFHLLLLLFIMTVALPRMRERYHNFFERVARLGSWLSLLLFWVELGDPAQSIGALEPTLLGFATWMTLLPWLKLKQVAVKISTPSSHVALANFDYGVTPFAGSSTDLSRNSLWEWHSFANVPSPGQNGFRLTISRAGDWTGQLIDDKPTTMWTKGIPTAGVGNIETLFKKVLWVATGSGIGPCLPHLLAQKVPAHLVWSTRSPVPTYGADLVNEILSVQPQALIWDTVLKGKPDLSDLVLKEFLRSGAEAVICISNKKTTWGLVHEMESRGIPAFGAIWDS